MIIGQDLKISFSWHRQRPEIAPALPGAKVRGFQDRDRSSSSFFESCLAIFCRPLRFA